MLIFALMLLTAQADLPPVSAASDYAHLTHAVIAPKLVHSLDPEYTPQALAAQIEGTVVLQAVIGASGYITHASVHCPLPAGLDQKALAVVKHWRYQPASMDTVEIPVLTTVDVIFRLPYQTHRPLPASLPDANYLAEAQKYDRDHSLRQAEHYYRLCAANGDATCQFHLGSMLVNSPDTNPNDYTQGIAWLELSKSRGNQPAAALLSTAAPKLSSIQMEWVAQLKPHLDPGRRPFSRDR